MGTLKWMNDDITIKLSEKRNAYKWYARNAHNLNQFFPNFISLWEKLNKLLVELRIKYFRYILIRLLDLLPSCGSYWSICFSLFSFF